MSKRQVRLATYLTGSSVAHNDFALGVSEELFTDEESPELLEALGNCVRPHYLRLMAAMTLGDRAAVYQILQEVAASGIVSGYAFREIEYDRDLREEAS